jgi:capsular polysaccharide biosynthesis protein
MAPILNPKQSPLLQKLRQFWDWLGHTPCQEDSSLSLTPDTLERAPHFLSRELSPTVGDTYQWLHHTQEAFTIDLIQNGKPLGGDLSLIPHPDSLKHATYHNPSLACESILTLPHGYVLGHYGAVMTPDWVLLGDQNVDERGLSHFVAEKSKWFIQNYQQHQLPVLCLPKRVLVLTHMWPDVYGHFLIESTTKLSLLEISPQEFDAVIVPSNTPPCVVEVLNQLGIPPEKLIRIKESEIIQAESLIILSRPSFYPFYNLGTLNWVRQKFLPHPHPPNAKGHRLVYWPRFDRRLKNETQMMNIMTHWGIECVDHRNMSLREQIDVLMETSVLICFHGSGLTNLIFLPPKATVIEIQQRQSNAPLFKGMAETCHYRFIELKSEMANDDDLKNHPPSHHMPSTLPPKRLETFLRQHMDLFATALSKEKTVTVLKNLIHSPNKNSEEKSSEYKPLPAFSMKDLFSNNNRSSFRPNQLMACEKGNTWPPESVAICHKNLENNIESLEPLIKKNREFQYLLTIKNGAILGDEGVFLTSNGQFIYDYPTYFLKHQNQWVEESGKLTLTKAFHQEEQLIHFLSGRILCLTGRYSNVYWHLFAEFLPRVLIAEKCSVTFDGIAISEKARRNIQSLIKPLGIPIEKVHFIQPDQLYFVDELLVPSITSNYTPSNTEVFQWLKEKYLPKESLLCKPFRKIFWARQKNCKRLSNADEIESWLAKQGFEIYEDVLRPIEEQARIFAEASVVIFPVGSGGTNLIFCQPHCKVIEIKTQFQPDYTFNLYKNLCHTLSLDHNCVIAETIFQHYESKSSQHDHGYLHLDDLIQTLNTLNLV